LDRALKILNERPPYEDRNIKGLQKIQSEIVEKIKSSIDKSDEKNLCNFLDSVNLDEKSTKDSNCSIIPGHAWCSLKIYCRLKDDIKWLEEISKEHWDYRMKVVAISNEYRNMKDDLEESTSAEATRKSAIWSGFISVVGAPMLTMALSLFTPLLGIPIDKGSLVQLVSDAAAQYPLGLI
jgi:hypothetical protein